MSTYLLERTMFESLANIADGGILWKNFLRKTRIEPPGIDHFILSIYQQQY
jgi:hypothetical protein